MIRRRSKLDVLSLALIMLALALFIMAAFCYLLGIYFFLQGPGVPPEFTLTEIGNFAGILGMLIVPLFIVTALIVQWREKRRDTTGKDIDTNPKRGAAGRS